MFVWWNGKKCFLFQKEAEACENDFDRWIYVLKNMETFNRLPWMAKDSVFHRLSEIADVSAMTKEERHYECLQKVLYITWQSNAY